MNTNHQDQLNNYNKNYKFLEILNNDFNYGQKKGYLDNIHIQLNDNKDEIQFIDKFKIKIDTFVNDSDHNDKK